MTNASNSVEFSPYFGGFILETLTIGMYGETRNAIREYLQNAFDSVQKAINSDVMAEGEGLIELVMGSDKDSLVIRDNGAGLSSTTAAETLTRVGASAKSHAKNAGFRGIGRLAGIVFSNTVTFTTKAKGDSRETSVVIDGLRMREAMAPGKGSSKSAEALLKECVTASQRSVADANAHYFEVRLEGFDDPPHECLSAMELEGFVSQVAPVPYHPEFPFVAAIQQAAAKHGIPIEQVRTTIRDGSSKPTDVYKPYRGAHACSGSSPAKIFDVRTHASSRAKWWGWWGVKEASGAYTDTKASGIRVRVRNIQIDGVDLFRGMFRLRGASSDRFQDWYIGEIFVAPDAVVPNARRDGFEEDENWKKLKREFESLAKKLGDDAYQLSTKGQYTVAVQKRNLEKAKKEYRILENSGFQDRDRTLRFSASITTYQKKIARGSVTADLESLAMYQAISGELTDLKNQALAQANLGREAVDVEGLRLDARDELLREIIVILEDGLLPSCFVKAKELINPLLSAGEL